MPDARDDVAVAPRRQPGGYRRVPDPRFEQSTCAAGNKCAPCANPFTGADTGSCGTIGCDQAAPSTPFTFPGAAATSVSAFRAPSPAWPYPHTSRPTTALRASKTTSASPTIRFRRPGRHRRHAVSRSPSYRLSAGTPSACRIASWATSRPSFRKPAAQPTGRDEPRLGEMMARVAAPITRPRGASRSTPSLLGGCGCARSARRASARRGREDPSERDRASRT